MRVLPAIDITVGAGVDKGPRFPPSMAVDVALGWEAQGCRMLHVVDLDAAWGRGSNTSTVRTMLTKVRVPLQIGGGLREDATIGLLLGEGARRAIVGTRALGDPQWLEAVATAHPGRIMVALDVLKGKAMVEGWRKEALRRPQEILPSLDPLPLAGILYTNLEVEGKRQGMDVAAVEQVMGATSHKVVVSGGVSTRRDLEELESVGVEEVVVGSALYRGDLPPEVVA